MNGDSIDELTKKVYDNDKRLTVIESKLFNGFSKTINDLSKKIDDLNKELSSTKERLAKYDMILRLNWTVLTIVIANLIITIFRSIPK